MPPRVPAKRRMLAVCIVAILCSALACSSEKSPTAPVSPTPPFPGTAPPIEIPIAIRDDAGTYGLLAPITLHEARLDGRTVLLQVVYGGGCLPHTYTAIGSTQFVESSTPQLTVYLRHDDSGDRCGAIFFRNLSFDVTPMVELRRALTGVDGPFYLWIVTPDSKKLVAVP